MQLCVTAALAAVGFRILKNIGAASYYKIVRRIYETMINLEV